MDLFGKCGELLCCDGEECVVVHVADNAIMLRALEAKDSFLLTRDEAQVAIFR